MRFRQVFRIGQARPAPQGGNRRPRIPAGAVRLGLAGTATAVLAGVAGTAGVGWHPAGPTPNRNVTAFVGDTCPPAGCGLNHNQVLL